LNPKLGVSFSRKSKTVKIMSEKISRRDFLKLAGLTSASLALSACGMKVNDLPTATSIPPTGTTLPTETLTPTLTSTPIPVGQLPQTKQILAEFVQTFQAVGADISTDQLIQKGLEIRTVTGKDKKQYEIVFVNISGSTQLEGDYPLMIKMDDKWNRMTLKHGNLLGITIGNTVEIDDYLWYREDYAKKQEENFDATFGTNVIYDQTFKKYGTEGIEKIADYARKGDLTLVLSNAFWSAKTPEGIANLPQDGQLRFKVEMDMRERLAKIFSIIQSRKGNKPIYFGGSHEVLDWYKGKLTWTDDVYFKAFGKEIFAETLKIEMDEAKKAGLILGTDIIFMVGATGCITPSPLLDSTVSEIIKAKQQVASELGIKIDDVPLGILAEGHAVQRGTVRGHDPVPTAQELEEAAKKLKTIGKVVFTEVEIQNATPDEVAIYWNNVLKAALKSGVDGVILWPGLRDCITQPIEDFCNPNGELLDSNGKKSYVYYKILADLFELN